MTSNVCCTLYTTPYFVFLQFTMLFKVLVLVVLLGFGKIYFPTVFVAICLQVQLFLIFKKQ